MARIAFVGTGRMGRGMAGRLLAAGHDVVLHNRTHDKASALVGAGAQWADSPAEAAAGADAVFVMVSDDEASRTVWQGPGGVLSGDVQPGAFAIDCSTLSHDWVMELSAAAVARGLRYLDCPVTGLPGRRGRRPADPADRRRPCRPGRRPSRCCCRCPRSGCTSDRSAPARRTS